MPAKIFEGRLFARLTSALPHPFFGGKKGFTLVELIVVLAVIGILATIMLANYNDFGARQEVRNAAEELKSNLRKYQTFAISGQKNPTNLPDGSGCNDDTRTLDNYSVVVDDTVTPIRYRAVLNCVDNNTTPPTPLPAVELPWVDLPEDFAVSTSCAVVSDLTIIFNPINEGVELRCVATSQTNAHISIVGDAIYQVNINDTGEINVESP